MELLRSEPAAIRRALLARQVSARELAAGALAAIRDRNPSLNAVVRTRDEAAIAEAEALDRRLAAGGPGEAGPLAGLPVVVKENMAIAGEEVTAASRVLEGFRPPYTATAVARLVAAGAVVVGIANMDEFAMGSSTENSRHGTARNPVDPARVAGGSSGGSAAAVAAGLVPASLGSDTGGSIRQPASFCGVVGLKPTYGRVSRFGLYAYASSLDQIGPFTRTVAGAADLLAAIAGPDPRDATSAEAPAFAPRAPGAKGIRVGVPREFMDTAKGLAPAVRAEVEAALDRLAAAGAEVREVSLPVLDHVIPTYYLIANAEASSNLSRYDGVRYGRRSPAAGDLAAVYALSRAEGMSREVQNRVLIGTYALSAGYADAWYKRADALRGELRARFAALLAEVDLIAGPAAPDTAFPLGAFAGDPLAMYMQDLYTTFVNLVSAPAVSVPCGAVRGLPVGLQLVGRPFDEATVLAAAAAVEQDSTWRPS